MIETAPRRTSPARGALLSLAGSLLLSGCSHWEFAVGGALGLVVGSLAVVAALGLVEAVRADFRGSSLDRPARRTINLLEPRPRPVRRRWANR